MREDRVERQQRGLVPAVRGRGALPWDAVLEAIDRIAAPLVTPAMDAPDAPIDTQLKSEIVAAAPAGPR